MLPWQHLPSQAQKVLEVLTSLNGFHVWIAGFRVSRDSPGRAWKGWPLSLEFLTWALTNVVLHAPLGLWGWVSDGLMASGMGVEGAGTGHFWGSPTYHFLPVFLWMYEWAEHWIMIFFLGSLKPLRLSSFDVACRPLMEYVQQWLQGHHQSCSQPVLKVAKRERCLVLSKEHQAIFSSFKCQRRQENLAVLPLLYPSQWNFWKPAIFYYWISCRITVCSFLVTTYLIPNVQWLGKLQEWDKDSDTT